MTYACCSGAAVACEQVNMNSTSDVHGGGGGGPVGRGVCRLQCRAITALGLVCLSKLSVEGVPRTEQP